MSNGHFLYILKSTIVPRRYIGISDDPVRRLAQHNAGATRSTKPYRPWTLVFTQQFISKQEARKRELFLKRTARARKELFDTIDNASRHGPIV